MSATPSELYLNNPLDRHESAFAVFGRFGVKHRDAVRVGQARVRRLEARLEAARRLAAVSPEEYRRVEGGSSVGAALLREVLDADRSDLEIICRVLHLDEEILAERAGVYEFDGGYDRREAERRALVDCIRAIPRLRKAFLAPAESGALLDLAYDLFDSGLRWSRS